MEKPNAAQRSHDLRAKLQGLYDEMGTLYQFYGTRVANPRVELAQDCRDLAVERARIEGEIAVLMLEHGRSDELDEATDEARANGHVEPRIAGVLDSIVNASGNGTVRVM